LTYCENTVMPVLAPDGFIDSATERCNSAREVH
jgi:hypothetical protein